MPPKPKSKLVQACNAMKDLGYPEKTVRPIVKELLKLYEDNWMLIEDDNYRVLVEAILDSEELNAHENEFKRLNTWSEDEFEEHEPTAKKPRINSQENQSSPFFSASLTNCGDEVENQVHDKYKLSEFISKRRQDKDTGVETSHVPIYYHRRKKSNSSPQSRIVEEEEMEYKFISDYGNNEFNSLVPFADLESHDDVSSLNRHFLEKGSTYELFSVDQPSFEVPLAVLPPDLEYPEVIDLDAEDANDIGTAHDLELNHSEPVNYQNSEAEEDEHDARDSLKLDIASSSRGDAKISISINASLGPGFRVPSLEDVLKQVEERCLMSYKIPQAGFSLVGLMKEVCESFLASGTTSENTECLGPENEISTHELPETPDSEIGLSEVTNNQLGLFSKPTMENDPDIIQNVFEVSPQIPRFSGSVQLDLSRPMIYLNVDASGCVMMDRDIKELNNVPHSSSEILVFQEKHGFCYIKDITKGHEDFEISLINEVNEDQCPAFNYISKNVTYKNASVGFPLARILEQDCCSACFGDCLSLDMHCACAGKTGCEFAYTPKGLVKEKFLNNLVSKSCSVTQHDFFYCQDCPLEHSINGNSIGKCKGHINRKFIKECWYKCGCSMNCGNRVVQRGITAKLQVFMTPEGKGWGLRTLEDLPKGAFICEYVGEVVTIRELFERNLQNTGDIQTFPVVLDAGWSSKRLLKDNEVLFLDATSFGNIARFINHRCFDANLIGIPVEVESPDHHYYHLAFFTTREVDALEELTWDYGIKFDDDHSVKAFQCHCGSKFCREPRICEELV